MYTVYSITNKLNGKRYIGISCDYKRRWYQHLWALQNNKHNNIKLQNSYNLHGEDNFEFSILEQLDCTFDEAAKLEVDYIAKFDSCNNGYNQSFGGDGTDFAKVSDETKRKIADSMMGNTYSLGIKRSDDTKKKMSESMKHCCDMEDRKLRGSKTLKNLWKDPQFRDKMLQKNLGNTYNLGKHHSEETKKKLSDDRLGENNPFFGKTHSDDTKAKLSNISTERWKDSNYVELVNKRRNDAMHTDEYRQKQSELSRGRSNKTTELDAITIRYRYLSGEKPIDIHKDFPKLSLSGLKKICYGSSWGHLPMDVKELYNMLINYQSTPEMG